MGTRRRAQVKASVDLELGRHAADLHPHETSPCRRGCSLPRPTLVDGLDLCCCEDRSTQASLLARAVEVVLTDGRDRDERHGLLRLGFSLHAAMHVAWRTFDFRVSAAPYYLNDGDDAASIVE